jgi:anti-sigma regulatory factor (Ser/Thr protein kinase)
LLSLVSNLVTDATETATSSEYLRERFDIRTVPDVDVDRDLRDRTPGGLGIHLLKRMVDDVGYEYGDGRSTTTFVKSLE